MIDTVIFDIGNVLVEFLPDKYVKLITDNEKLGLALIKATFGHPIWQELDRGTVEEETAVHKMIADAPELAEYIKKMFSKGWAARILKPMAQSMEFLRELKAEGYKLYLLSNYHRDTFRYITETHKEFELFDGGVISWQVQANKPEPQIYKCLIEKYGLNPKSCVFIDDLQANLNGASDFGIHTVLFKDIAQVKKDFRRIAGELVR